MTTASALRHRLISSPRGACAAWGRSLFAGVVVTTLSALAVLSALSVAPPAAAIEQAPTQFLFSLLDAPPAAVARPDHVDIAHAVSLDFDSLTNARVGAQIAFALSSDTTVQLRIDRVDTLANGDRVIAARGLVGGDEVGFTMTFSKASVYGYLQASGVVYQLSAASGPDASRYEGWFYRAQGFDAARLQNDSIILPQAGHVTRPAPLSLAPLSLSSAARLDETRSTDEAGLGITVAHTFGRRAVRRGESVAVSVRLSNTTSQTRRAQVFDVYFLAESGELSWGAADCNSVISDSAQQVVRCNVGVLDARSSITVPLTFVATSSSPRLVQSTVLVNGEDRADAVLRVVSDVRSDTDGDGLSDFNEGLLGTAADDAQSVDLAPTVIDIIALHSQESASLYPFGAETRINQLVAVANQVFIDSGADVRLRVVYHGAAGLAGADDMGATLESMLEREGAFGSIETLRSEFGGDIVLYFRPLEFAASRCGLAPVGGYASEGDFSDPGERFNATAVVAIDCPLDIVVAHEVGHLLGLTHSLREEGEGGTFEFSTGHGVTNQFATLMALPNAFGSAERASVFSSPLLRCGDLPCGIAEGAPNAADAVATLNLVRHQIGRYSEATTAQLNTVSVATLTGASSKAKIAVGASSDGYRSLTTRVSGTDLVSVAAEVQVDPVHIGRKGGVIVLLALEGASEIYQLDTEGRVVMWDGSLTGLQSFGGSSSLRAVEQLTILNRLRLGDILSGAKLGVFIAYQVESARGDTDEIVYPNDPFWLSVAP